MTTETFEAVVEKLAAEGIAASIETENLTPAFIRVSLPDGPNTLLFSDMLENFEGMLTPNEEDDEQLAGFDSGVSSETEDAAFIAAFISGIYHVAVEFGWGFATEAISDEDLSELNFTPSTKES